MASIDISGWEITEAEILCPFHHVDLGTSYWERNRPAEDHPSDFYCYNGQVALGSLLGWMATAITSKADDDS